MSWEILIACVCIFFLWIGYTWIEKRKKRLIFPYTPLLRSCQGTESRIAVFGKKILPHLALLIRSGVLISLLLALLGILEPPRPKTRDSQSEGLDMVLVIDTSGSMRALDFSQENNTSDRLTAVKNVVTKFIERRPDDRIGLVAFGANVLSLVPLTIDHQIVQQKIEEMSIGMAGDATALGDAIAVGARRLKHLKAKSKIMILLTDGKQTAGELDPLAAAEAAKALNIKIYTIGVGKPGKVPFPARGLFGREVITWVESDLDEDTLKKISEMTNGDFFRAYDTESLEDIYNQIERLEKRSIKRIESYSPPRISMAFIWWAIGLLVVESVFACTRWRRIP